MKEKIRFAIDYLKYSRYGALFVPLAVYILLLLTNIINTLVLNGSNALILVFVPLSLLAPAAFWVYVREKKRYIPSLKLNLPQKEHLLPLLLSFVVLAAGSVLLEMLFSGSDYINFSLYNAFFVSRDRGFFDVFYILIAFAIIPAILEELLFRGILCAELERGGVLCSVLISSLFYSFIGFSFSMLPTCLFVGVMLSVVLYATRSIFCAVILHILYNVFAIFALPSLVAIKDVSANHELFVFLVLILAVGALILLCLQLSKLYRLYSVKQESLAETRSMPLYRTAHDMAEALLSPFAICSIVIFLVASIILII